MVSPASRRLWWGGQAASGDAGRLEAFSDGVLAIAITLLILDVHVDKVEGRSLADGLQHASPELIAFAASFLQIGILWANHHVLFRLIARVDQILLLANMLLLAGVSFLPFPTRLIAAYTHGDDATTAMLLYGGTFTLCAVAFNIIWHYASRRGLLHEGIDPRFHRDVTVRYGWTMIVYLISTLLALVDRWLTLGACTLLALLYVLGPSPRSAFLVDRPAPEQE